MSIIKERIRLSNNSSGATITFGLSGRERLSGYQQEIDGLTEDTKQDLVNPVIDNEVRRYNHKDIQNIYFYFSKRIGAGGAAYSNSFTSAYAGFSRAEIDDYDDVVLNSFFIMDFYNSFDYNTQSKIFTTYLTQILDGETSGGDPIPTYSLRNDNVNQWYHQYVPQSFLDTQTGSTITGYTKFSFYNAKFGTISLFYDNDSSVGLTSPETMYFKTYLYLDTMQWEFERDTLHPYEVGRDSAYSTKVNNTFENFDNLQQTYPVGAFDPEDGTYEGGSGASRRSSRSATRTR